MATHDPKIWKQGMKKIPPEFSNQKYKILYQEFTTYLQIVGYSSITACQLSKSVKDFLYTMEQNCNNNISRIKSADIQEYCEYLQCRPNKYKDGAISTVYIHHHLYSLKVFFNYLEKTAQIRSNPISSLRFPQPKHTERTALTIEEIKQLYDATETLRDRAMLGLFYGCGLRKSEGVSLNTTDIKLRDKILIVREGKGHKRRVIPLAAGVRQDFDNYYHYERGQYLVTENPAFVINNRGNRMTGDSYIPRLKYLVIKSGINQSVCLHQLRHSIATHLLEKGMSLEKVRDFLGHKRIDTTQIYTHIKQIKLI